jgi:DNA polymerase III delta prime subunit
MDPRLPLGAHVLLYGPSGSGKSTLAKQYGEHFFNGRVFVLDGAFDRGIDSFREDIHNLSRMKKELSLVIIENADRLSNAYQDALRRVMETQSHIIRFAFCVWHDPRKLNHAIRSRCVCIGLPAVKDHAEEVGATHEARSRLALEGNEDGKDGAQNRQAPKTD